MHNSGLAAKLQQRLDEGSPDYTKAVQKLRDLVADVQSAVGQAGVVVRLEPGHSTNLGQQLNIVTFIPETKFIDVLFRVYVPPLTGWPVTLDLLQPDYVQCNDAGELEERVSEFVSSDEIVNRLRMLREVGGAA